MSKKERINDVHGAPSCVENQRKLEFTHGAPPCVENQRKLEYIYEHYGSLMYQKANSILRDSYEAEDAVQEAMIRLLGIADKIEDAAATKTRILAITVAKNVAIDLWRKKARTMPIEGELLELEAENETTEQLIANKEHFSGFIKVFLKMPDAYRDVLQLRCVYELSAEETARLLGTNANAVNIKLTRARKILKTRYSVIASLFAICGVGVVGLRTWHLVGDPGAGSTALTSAERSALTSADADLPETTAAAGAALSDSPDTDAAASSAGTDTSPQISGSEDLPPLLGAVPEDAGQAPSASMPSIHEDSSMSAAETESVFEANAASVAAVTADIAEENGLRRVTLEDTSGQEFTLILAPSNALVEEALSAALPDTSFTQDAAAQWHTAVENDWIILRLFEDTAGGDAKLIRWEYGDYSYALYSTQAVDENTLKDVAAAYADYQ